MSISARSQIRNVTSSGLQPHYLILWKVPDGTIEEQKIELVGGFFGPLASSEAIASPGIQAAIFRRWKGAPAECQINLVEVDLEADTHATLMLEPT